MAATKGKDKDQNQNDRSEKMATAAERSINNLQAVIDDIDTLINGTTGPQAQIMKGWKGSVVYIRKQMMDVRDQVEATSTSSAA